MSQQRYINKLTKSGNWIVGTIQGDPVKPNAENMARASLSAHIRSHVSQKLIQELNEVISSDKDKDFISERTETTLSVITDETIMGVNPISIKKDGMWWSIALKCKEEYSKERKDYIELDRKPENWLHGWLMYVKKVRELNKISQARN